MTDIGIILFLLVILSSVYILLTSRDPASPQFIFITILGVFFSDIYFENYNLFVYAIFILILVLILLVQSIYFISPNKINFKISTYKYDIKSHKVPSIIFWIMSIPSLIAYYYLVNKFGGFDGFIEASKHRTRTFAGLGITKTLISTFYVIHLYYFSYLINLNFKKNSGTYFLYIIHFMIFLFIASFSFSRGTLLVMFVLMGLVWHYSRKRIKVLTVVVGLIALLMIASSLSIIRETVTIQNGKLELNYTQSEQKYRYSWMWYGTYPLDTMLSAKDIDPKLGSTYIAALTNFVPRSLWPGKLDPGGVVFTKEYTDRYDQWSDFTTGIIPEAIINFGILGGIFFGAFQFFFLNIIINYSYIKNYFRRKQSVRSNKDIFILIIYIYSLVYVTAHLTGEFANITVRYIIQVSILVSTYILINTFYQQKK